MCTYLDLRTFTGIACSFKIVLCLIGHCSGFVWQSPHSVRSQSYGVRHRRLKCKYAFTSLITTKSIDALRLSGINTYKGTVNITIHAKPHFGFWLHFWYYSVWTCRWHKERREWTGLFSHFWPSSLTNINSTGEIVPPTCHAPILGSSFPAHVGITF